MRLRPRRRFTIETRLAPPEVEAPTASSTIPAIALLAMSSALMPVPLGAQARAAHDVQHIPLARGVVISQIEHGVGGERESTTEIEDASPAGVRYGWRYREIHTTGDTVLGTAARFVSGADLASAARMHLIYDVKGPLEHPGYTAWSVSSAVYQQLRASGTAPLQMMRAELASGSGLGFSLAGAQWVPVRWRGTLTRAAAAPESFPLLVNGRRVAVPSVRARAQLTARGRQWSPDVWILADSAHPLLLKVASTDPPITFQVTRVDLPDEASAAAGIATPGGRVGGIERDLASACRAELPGVYFAFNSAALDPASDRTIATVAAMLARHPDWTVTIEGHTDSIGGATANRALSERRASAVRERLVNGHRVDAARLKFAGHGASRPREPNATIEGRARNRRVELARDCAGRVAGRSQPLLSSRGSAPRLLSSRGSASSLLSSRGSASDRGIYSTVLVAGSGHDDGTVDPSSLRSSG